MIFDTFDQMWRSVVWNMRGVKVRDSRVGPCREVVGFQATVLNPRSYCRSRKFSPVYAAAEFLWYLSFDPSGEMITHYAPSYKRFLENGVARGHYGARWHQQIEPLINELKGDPNTRRAVLATWLPSDVGTVTVDQPCTLTLQFLLRDKRLNLVVTMRSNDVWLGTPYDVFSFSRLQKLIADHLEVGLGTYTHQVGSMHLYERDFDKAQWRAGGYAVPDYRDFYYTPVDAVNVTGSAMIASNLESSARAREEAEMPVWLASFENSGLKDSELGAMVLLCASKRWPTVLFQQHVDPVLVQMEADR